MFWGFLRVHRSFFLLFVFFTCLSHNLILGSIMLHIHVVNLTQSTIHHLTYDSRSMAFDPRYHPVQVVHRFTKEVEAFDGFRGNIRGVCFAPAPK